jgi:hypothetical protein
VIFFITKRSNSAPFSFSASTTALENERGDRADAPTGCCASLPSSGDDAFEGETPRAAADADGDAASEAVGDADDEAAMRASTAAGPEKGDEPDAAAPPAATALLGKDASSILRC